MEQRKQKKRHRIFLVSESTKEDMRMANVLQQYFPMIRTRKEILGEISENKRLRCIWQEWNEEQQKEFMKFCPYMSTSLKLPSLFNGMQP